MKNKYGLHLREPRAFGVRIGRDAVVPAELCEIALGQVYKKKLDPADTTEFLRVSVMKPTERLAAIRNAVEGDVCGHVSFPCWLSMTSVHLGFGVSEFSLDGRGRHDRQLQRSGDSGA